MNILLNEISSKVNKPYDKNGEMAAKGKVIDEMLIELNQQDYYQQSPPKSLGKEWVKKNIDNILNKYNIEHVNDVLRTLVEHISIQISAQAKGDKSQKMLITGGGAYNEFLIEQIENKCNLEIVIPAPKLIEYKEAMIFGLMGALRSNKLINCLKSVTGASKDSSAGVLITS